MAHRGGSFVRPIGAERALMEHRWPVRGGDGLDRNPRPGRVGTTTLLFTGVILALPFILTAYLAFAVLILLPVIGLRALLVDRTDTEARIVLGPVRR